MPGTLEHIAFAKEVYRNMPSNISINHTLFMVGNLIPDIASDHSKAHYRKPASIPGLFTPDMKQVKTDLYSLNNALFLGMYSHLYLDDKFIECFLIPEFIWDYEAMKIINPRNGMQWKPEVFFAQEGIYDSYSEINSLLLRDGHVSIKDIDEIPETPPLTGIPVFDNWKQESWKEEIYGYLAEKKPYTGNIFDYDRLWNFIKKTAIQFVKELFS